MPEKDLDGGFMNKTLDDIESFFASFLANSPTNARVRHLLERLREARGEGGAHEVLREPTSEERDRAPAGSGGVPVDSTPADPVQQAPSLPGRERPEVEAEGDGLVVETILPPQLTAPGPGPGTGAGEDTPQLLRDDAPQNPRAGPEGDRPVGPRVAGPGGGQDVTETRTTLDERAWHIIKTLKDPRFGGQPALQGYGIWAAMTLIDALRHIDELAGEPDYHDSTFCLQALGQAADCTCAEGRARTWRHQQVQ